MILLTVSTASVCMPPLQLIFFFNDTATTEIYTLSLHDALPICSQRQRCRGAHRPSTRPPPRRARGRSEEHTSELQSQFHLVCRLLLEKKKKKQLSHLTKKKKNQLTNTR